MAETAPIPAPSKARVFARRAGSTVFLWGLIGVAFASMWAWAYLGLIALLTVVATREYFRMLEAAGLRCFPRFGLGLALVYCGVLHAGFFRLAGGSLAGWDLFAISVALCGAFILQMREPIRGIESLVAVMLTLGGFVYVALLFNFTAKLLFLAPSWQLASGKVAAPAAILVMWLLAVTKFTDMGAYLVGSLIGRHKMIPHVSPGKTWEGLGGALVFSQLAGCGLYAWLPQQLAVLGGWGHVVFLGFLLAILAVLGDLAESVLKRALQAKDSGRMLPGIGGALDLIDSICFTAPALYFYLQWVLLPAP
ncbi:MAG: phosphatidate cytidylyltransferase [Verrucomicrobiota bacterium]